MIKHLLSLIDYIIINPKTFLFIISREAEPQVRGSAFLIL